MPSGGARPVSFASCRVSAARYVRCIPSTFEVMISLYISTCAFVGQRMARLRHDVGSVRVCGGYTKSMMSSALDVASHMSRGTSEWDPSPMESTKAENSGSSAFRMGTVNRSIVNKDQRGDDFMDASTI